MSDRGQQGRGRSGHRGAHRGGRGAQGGGGGSGSESGPGSARGRGRGQSIAPSISRDSSVSSAVTNPQGAPFRGRGARGGSISRESSSSPSVVGGPGYEPRGRGSSSSRGGGYGPPRGHGGPPSRARGSGGGGPRGGFGGGGGGAASGPYTQSGGPEARLTAQEQRDLVSLLSRVKISSTPSSSASTSGRTVISASPFAIRPSFGTKGRAISLYANFFAMKYPKNLVLYDYVIAVKPDVSKKGRERARVFEALANSPEFQPFIDNAVHDSAQRLITDTPLPDDFVINLRVEEPRGGGEPPKASVYQVSFPEYNELDTAELERYLAADPAYAGYNTKPIISAFQLITTFHASTEGVRFGKNKYYFAPNLFGEGQRDLSPGLEAWKGFFTSVRPVYKQLMVNVNVCMSPFFIPTENLVHAWEMYQRNSRGSGPPPFDFFQKVSVTLTYLGYRKKSAVKGFGKTADQTTFDCAELGGKVSVTQYFQRKYRIQLQHRNVPLVNIGPRSNRNKDTWVPMELCSIEQGQPYRGLLTEDGTAQMIRFACNPPGMNANTIVQQGLPILGYTDQAGALAGFNIGVEQRMTIVPARILEPPRIQYSSGQPRIQNGSWNVLGVKFSTPASLSGFSVLVIKDNGRDDFAGNTDPALRGIIQGFMEKCRACGMQLDNQLPQLRIAENLPHPRDDPMRARALATIEQTIKSFNPKPKLIMVFMSNKDAHLYPGLKTMCDIRLGVATVCMLNGKVRKERGQDQYFSNIALKVNTKLGGVNHQLDPAATKWLKNTMLVGMDVTHPSPGMVKGLPSIVAVVASCDDSFMLYPASMRLQRPDPNRMSKEEIDEGREMMVERLATYQRKMGKLPDSIVIFRDGVAENQYDMVLNAELPRIKAAFRAFRDYRPKITLAICAKRHHTRAFVQNPGDADRTGNTPAGTVIDQGITSVFDFDFYLQPHACLQGTVRSTHYTVLHDENKFGADEIQGGTNALSYMWARATKGVSLVPPAYWADTACERGRCYLREVISSPDSRRLTEDQVWEKSRQLWGEGVHDSLKNTMYYL